MHKSKQQLKLILYNIARLKSIGYDNDNFRTRNAKVQKQF